MTDKQKKAVMVLMDLYTNDHISEKDYFLLLEFVVDNTDKQETMYSPTILHEVPTPRCWEKDGTCTNPFHDCINCPKPFGTGDYVTTTNTNGIKEEEK